MKGRPLKRYQNIDDVRHYKMSYETHAADSRHGAFEEIICSIPRGKVATYGQVAEAAGYPRNHRAVARFLGMSYYLDLPWHRVLGAGGEIKVKGRASSRQRSLLRAEGVTFLRGRVDINKHLHRFE